MCSGRDGERVALQQWSVVKHSLGVLECLRMDAVQCSAMERDYLEWSGVEKIDH